MKRKKTVTGRGSSEKNILPKIDKFNRAQRRDVDQMASGDDEDTDIEDTADEQDKAPSIKQSIGRSKKTPVVDDFLNLDDDQEFADFDAAGDIEEQVDEASVEEVFESEELSEDEVVAEVTEEVTEEVTDEAALEEVVEDEASEDEAYEDDIVEDETCEDETYEDETYEDETYEDEIYEDEDFDDYADYDEIQQSSKKRGKNKRRGISAASLMAAVLGITIVVGSVGTVAMYKRYNAYADEASTAASSGESLNEGGTSEDMSYAAASYASSFEDLTSADAASTVATSVEVIEVKLALTTIKSDLKIKFTNSETGKLIASVPFKVKVTGKNGKTIELVDEDMDGVIYQKKIDADDYTVSMEDLDEEYSDRFAVAKEETVSVTDQVQTKVVDVSDEVKKESEVNVAKEDTTGKDKVESANKDTVAYVESSKQAVAGEGSSQTSGQSSTTSQAAETSKSTEAATTQVVDDGYQKIDKTSIAAPDTVSKLTAETAQTSVLMSYYGEANEEESQQEEISEDSSEENNYSEENNDSEDNNESESEDDHSSEEQDSDHSSEETSHPSDSVKRTLSVPAKASVVVGRTVKIEPTVTGASNTHVTWESENEEIATVSGEGVVTGVATGSVTIIGVLDEDDSVIAECAVSVSAGDQTLKDKNGNTVYVIKNGEYVAATYEDYYNYSEFYILKDAKAAASSSTSSTTNHKSSDKASTSQAAEETETDYKYTGWQTIDGHTYYYDQNGNYVTGDQTIQGVNYTFDDQGRLTKSAGTLGIDVSKWNGSIDWNAVKNSGVHFVIIRCGYRGSTEGALIQDSAFTTNIQGAKAAGLAVGVYFTTQAVDEAEAVEEASMAVSLANSYGISYPVYLDVEKSGGRGDSISVEQRTSNIQAFCNTVASAGLPVGVYANSNWFTEKINTPALTGYKIWLAQYTATATYSRTRYDMWQYTSAGTVSGIKGKVDMNLLY